APESTESNIRYAAYATRIRTALLSAQRYVAYTSDVGESFRPVAHPNLVRAAYGISWCYLAGDVAFEGYKAYCANQRTLHPESAGVPAHQHVADAVVGYLAGDVAFEGYKAYCANQRTLHPESAGVPAHQHVADAVVAGGEDCGCAEGAVSGDCEYGVADVDDSFYCAVFGAGDEECEEPEVEDVGAGWVGVECCAGVAVFV
ncbi:hypothetical protein V495_03126, partial [Pseudogymnoascus sp. VKM F-4514 (FW-929)]